MADMMTGAKDKMRDMGNTASQAASQAADQVRNAASAIGDRARDAASSVSRSAEDTASYLGSKAEDATSAVGSRLKAAGDAIRQNAPHEGAWGHATDTVARKFEETGDYLQQRGFDGLTSDMTNLIRRNPIPAILLGVGFGFLVARSMSDRS